MLAVTACAERRDVVLTLVLDGKLRELIVSRSTAAAIGKSIFDALKA